MPENELGKGSVLVVDDEGSVLEILDQFLTDRGFEVSTAENGSEAAELLETRRFDVALVDLKLPDIDGLEIVGGINAKFPETKCIIMTAFASMESTIEALRLSAFDYILKPFDLIKIAEVVEAAYAHVLMLRESTGIIRKLEWANRKLEESKTELNSRVYKANEELGVANESLKKHVTRLKMLYQMGRDISSNENWSDALDRFLMALCKYLEADGTVLLMFSDSGRTLKVRTSFGLESEFLSEAVRILSVAREYDLLQAEIFNLDGCEHAPVKTCLAMNGMWTDSVVPLLYRGRWLGLLLIRKTYENRRSYLNDYHFINTIQTILTEEVANAENISRLRNLKDFNETILENMGSGVIKTDRDGNVVFRNSLARELTGDVSGGKICFNDIFDNPFGAADLFEYLIDDERKTVSLECVLRTIDGPSMPVRMISTKVLTDDYRGTTLVVVFEDLTLQKAMEEELRRADRLRSLGELSAGVAHEIRNPLTGIATTAQVLKEKLSGEADKIKYLTVILDEIRRLDDIIRNLLSFARPALPRPEEVGICSVIRDAIDLLENKSEENGVNVSFESELEDDMCYLDRDQIKQVVLNIASNGIEACQDGGEVTVTVRNAVDPHLLKLEFADNGIGIPDEAVDKLYNPFFTTRSEGTGLGLSITRKIVESHGGRIFHKNGIDSGTLFVVEIPRRIAAALNVAVEERIS
ncbi:MAG: response regulator [Bacteroidales bacterium]|nr:response regulator [Candidatus Latescibacterota bacterium]